MRDGRLRAIATASAKRAALAPDVPTKAELGYPIDFDTWYALFAPAGTPREIVAKLNAETNRELAQQDLKDRGVVLGVEMLGTTPERLTARRKAEIARWTKVGRDANIRAAYAAPDNQEDSAMQLPEIDRLRLTSVVDNFVDNLLKDQGPAKRRPRQPKAWERCLLEAYMGTSEAELQGVGH